jgi:hypothetical protein
MAQRADNGGNVFNQTNNRQPDIPEVIGSPATGAFYARSRLKAIDGDFMTVGNGGSAKIIEVDSHDPAIAGGRISLVTGSSNTEFWNNVTSSLTSAGYTSTYAITTPNPDVNFKQDYSGGGIVQTISSSNPNIYGLDLAAYAFRIYASSSTNANGYFISTRNINDYNSAVYNRQILLDGGTFKIKWTSKHNVNNVGYVAEKQYNNFWTGRTAQWLDLLVTFRTVDGASPAFADVQLYVNGAALTPDSEIDGGGVIAGGTSTYTEATVDQFYFAFQTASSGATHRLSNIHLSEMAFYNTYIINSAIHYSQSLYYDFSHNDYYNNLIAWYRMGNSPNDSITGTPDSNGTLVLQNNVNVNENLLGTTPTLKWNFHSSSGLTQEPYAYFSVTSSQNGIGFNDLAFTLNANSNVFTDQLDSANSLFFYSPLNGGINDVQSDSIVLSVPTPLLNGNKNESIISSRFSAPGGQEIQSNAYLDVYSREFSVHNALPFRNLTVLGAKVLISGSTPGGGSGEATTIRLNNHLSRREGLKALLTRPSGKFGVDSAFGSVSKTTYTTDGSFVKQHRNRSRRAEFQGENIITASNHDNGWVSSPIPRSDLQYSWVNNIISGSNFEGRQKIFGYAPYSGFISSSVDGILEAIIFPSSSNIS